MDHFACPRCLAVSWSPDAVAAGYCATCCTVTRIEGLRVSLHWRAGEWVCVSCGVSFTAPYSHVVPATVCACGRVMTKQLHAEATAGPAADLVRRPADDGMSLAELENEPYTARDYCRLARNQTVIDSARALILNHSAPFPDEEGEIPWTDPATWSPGDTEL